MSSSDPGARLLDPGTVTPVRLEPSGVSDFGGFANPDRFDEGFAAGARAGREAAEAESEATLADALRRLGQAETALGRAVEELRSARRELLDSEIASAATLAVELTETLVGALPARLDPGRLVEALALVPDDADVVVVRLHPDDIVALDTEGPLDAKIVADSEIEPGGCVVEVGPMSIDAQRAPALARVRAVLGEITGAR